jgi:DNA adenine methylase
MSVPRILHYPGSKWSMAEWIIRHMPPHTTYLEPFFGSGAVLFNKAPVLLETINDLDGDVVNLFRVIRDQPEELARLVHWTPYAREEYLSCQSGVEDGLEQARRFLVRCWQSIRVKTGSISGWKCRGTPDDAYRVKQWNALPSKLTSVAERLKEVQIECRPAVEVIKRYRRPDVLIYADPPYLSETRNGAIYANEMTDKEHAELLAVLSKHPGPVLLSGYASRLYDEVLAGWHREEMHQVIETGQNRTEVLWINPVSAEAMEKRQLQLF